MATSQSEFPSYCWATSREKQITEAQEGQFPEDVPRKLPATIKVLDSAKSRSLKVCDIGQLPQIGSRRLVSSTSVSQLRITKKAEPYP
jgi:hypothetical protein